MVTITVTFKDVRSGRALKESVDSNRPIGAVLNMLRSRFNINGCLAHKGVSLNQNMSFAMANIEDGDVITIEAPAQMFSASPAPRMA